VVGGFGPGAVQGQLLGWGAVGGSLACPGSMALARRGRKARPRLPCASVSHFPGGEETLAWQVEER